MCCSLLSQAVVSRADAARAATHAMDKRIARLLRFSTTFNLKSFKCVPLEREIDAT